MHTTVRRIRASVAVGILVLATLAVGSPAASAAPVNNAIGHAIVIGTVPYNNTLNTSGSTTKASDPKNCHNNGSVWYRYTAAATGRLIADTVGSRYDTTLGVYSGSPGSLALVACNDDGWDETSVVNFRAVAGTTYFFMVGECCGNGRAGGGSLVLHLRRSPTVTVRNSPSGSVSRLTGDATVGGMIRCNGDLTGFMIGTLTQRIGEFTLARGSSGQFDDEEFPDEMLCSTVRSRWGMTISPESTVPFIEGDATLRLRGSFCRPEAPWRCAEFDRTRVVHLTER